jgi:hypothetical protein
MQLGKKTWAHLCHLQIVNITICPPYTWPIENVVLVSNPASRFSAVRGEHVERFRGKIASI